MTKQFEIQTLFKAPTPNLFYSDNFSDYVMKLSNGKVLYCHKVILNFYSNKFFDQKFMDEVMSKTDHNIVEKMIKLLYDNIYEFNHEFKFEVKDNELKFNFELIDGLIKLAKLFDFFEIKNIQKDIEKCCNKLTMIKGINTYSKINIKKELYDNYYFSFRFNYHWGEKEFKLFLDEHFGYIEIFVILEQALNIQLFKINQKKNYSTLILNDDICAKIIDLLNENENQNYLIYISSINHYLSGPHLFDLIKLFKHEGATIIFNYFLSHIQIISSPIRDHIDIYIKASSFSIDCNNLQKMFERLVKFSNNLDENCGKDKKLLCYLLIFTNKQDLYTFDVINSFEQNKQILFVDRLICRIFYIISYLHKRSGYQLTQEILEILQKDKEFKDLILLALKIKESTISVDKFIQVLLILMNTYHISHSGMSYSGMSYSGKEYDYNDSMMSIAFVTNIKLFDSLCEFVIQRPIDIHILSKLTGLVVVRRCDLEQRAANMINLNHPDKEQTITFNNDNHKNIINFFEILLKYNILDHRILNGDLFKFSPEVINVLEKFVKPCNIKPAVHNN